MESLAALEADVLVVAAYGFLLPAPALAMPRLGCINVHASILPRWRGAAPVQHALLAGDAQTGVSIMLMDAGLDTGPVLSTRACDIAPDDTGGSLTGRLAALGAAALVDTLHALETGAVEARPQCEALATMAPKLSKAQAAIDWERPAAEIERMVRAFDPWPVAYTYLPGTDAPALRVWRAEVETRESDRAPGTVLACDKTGLVVSAAQGAVRITEVQPAGARRMSAAEFIRGRRLAPGTRLVRGPRLPAGARKAARATPILRRGAWPTRWSPACSGTDVHSGRADAGDSNRGWNRATRRSRRSWRSEPCATCKVWTRG